jgi:DNA repair exonuclease SbcCD ATPase subunit
MVWTIDIERIAGILHGSATIQPGLNAVQAANWQGKSSFVEAVKTALGTSTELTEGADSGHVDLQTPAGDTTVRLVRNGSTVSREGTPYLDDEYDVIRAELFACLDEHNEIRRAVRRGDNLEEVLLEPLDFQNIDEQIAELKRERERVESELSQATEASKRLPSVQEKVTRLNREIEELREQREAIEPGEEGEDSTQQQLNQARSDKRQAETRVDQLEQSIERTRNRLSEHRTELDELDVPDHENVDEQLERVRAELDDVKRDAEILQSLYSATEMVLDESRLDLITDVQRDIAGDTVTCWTCGNDTTREGIESQLDALGNQLTEHRAAAEQHRDRAEELEARREQQKQIQHREEELKADILELEEQLADRQQSLADTQERLDAASTRADELAETVDETMSERSDIESEIKYREAELDDATAELDELDARADKIDRLETELESMRTEIEDLRSRKDRVKREARTAFDQAIDDIVSRFETGFESARLTADFDIVVARDGREASLTALSEGELELIGFVAALAGWQAFDVGESVPLIVVDSVGGLDDENLHTLVEYLRDRTEYLVFTAYPEYTDFDGHRIDPTVWTVANEGTIKTN